MLNMTFDFWVWSSWIFDLVLQDVLNCLILAETVYKVQAGNHAEVATTVMALKQDFPAPLVSLERLQWSLPHIAHR